MSIQFCVANLFVINSTGLRTMRGYSFYGTLGSKQKDGTWSRDTYDTTLTCKVEPAGKMCASWTDHNGESITIDLSGIDIPNWLKDTKANGRALDSKKPGDIYCQTPIVVDGFSIKLIWNKEMSDILTHNKANPKKPRPLPEKASDQWTLRFLVNEHRGMLVPGEEYITDDDWF